MTITGNGYGAEYVREGAHYRLSVWKGEQFGARTFTSATYPHTLESAMRGAQDWSEAMRAERAPMAERAAQIVYGNW